MNADGSNPTRLTNDGGVDVLPSWSPDGTRLLRRSRRTGRHMAHCFDGFGVQTARMGPQEGSRSWLQPVDSRIKNMRSLLDKLLGRFVLVWTEWPIRQPRAPRR